MIDYIPKKRIEKAINHLMDLLAEEDYHDIILLAYDKKAKKGLSITTVKNNKKLIYYLNKYTKSVKRSEAAND